LLIIALAPGLLMVYFGQQSIDRASTAVHLPLEAGQLVPTLEGELNPPPIQAAPLPDEEPPRPSRQELLQNGKTLEKAGYVWLFCISAFLVIRLFVDPTMVRRPMLEPNLTI